MSKAQLGFRLSSATKLLERNNTLTYLIAVKLHPLAQVIYYMYTNFPEHLSESILCRSETDSPPIILSCHAHSLALTALDTILTWGCDEMTKRMVLGIRLCHAIPCHVISCHHCLMFHLHRWRHSAVSVAACGRFRAKLRFPAGLCRTVALCLIAITRWR